MNRDADHELPGADARSDLENLAPGVESEALRIIDVNLNRASEALRVIEDYARFVLDDAGAAMASKDLRHDVRHLARWFSPSALLAARDIQSDVGRETKTSAELRRDSIDSVVHAAFGRLTQAARSLGEYGKLVDGVEPEAIEKVRYRAYELEQLIVLRGALRARFRACRLYVILTESLCRRPWLETADAALAGGAGCLQLREKSLAGRPVVGDAELLARAAALRELTSRRGALLIINDRPDIARLARADGVHVGQDDLSVRAVRRIAGSHMLVGKSTHNIEQFEAALAEKPDYIAVGPMFSTSTKPQTHIPGSELLSRALERAKSGTPPETAIVAIGGIDGNAAQRLFSLGASCVAVCSAIISSSDPTDSAAACMPHVSNAGKGA